MLGSLGEGAAVSNAIKAARKTNRANSHVKATDGKGSMPKALSRLAVPKSVVGFQLINIFIGSYINSFFTT